MATEGESSLKAQGSFHSALSLDPYSGGKLRSNLAKKSVVSMFLGQDCSASSWGAGLDKIGRGEAEASLFAQNRSSAPDPSPLPLVVQLPSFRWAVPVYWPGLALWPALVCWPALICQQPLTCRPAFAPWPASILYSQQA